MNDVAKADAMRNIMNEDINFLKVVFFFIKFMIAVMITMNETASKTTPNKPIINVNLSIYLSRGS